MNNADCVLHKASQSLAGMLPAISQRDHWTEEEDDNAALAMQHPSSFILLHPPSSSSILRLERDTKKLSHDGRYLKKAYSSK